MLNRENKSRTFKVVKVENPHGFDQALGCIVDNKDINVLLRHLKKLERQRKLNEERRNQLLEVDVCDASAGASCPSVDLSGSSPHRRNNLTFKDSELTVEMQQSLKFTPRDLES